MMHDVIIEINGILGLSYTVDASVALMHKIAYNIRVKFIYLGGCFMYALADFIWLMIDKFTDKVADYIKFKELENRIKIK